jgi:hypothetical protein
LWNARNKRRVPQRKGALSYLLKRECMINSQVEIVTRDYTKKLITLVGLGQNCLLLLASFDHPSPFAPNQQV